MIPQIGKCLVRKSELSISVRFLSTFDRPFEPIPVAEYLINQHQFSQQVALKASSTFPHVKNPQKLDSVLSFLSESGFSKAHLERAIRRFPEVLSAKVETIEPKIKVLQDSGFSPSQVAEILSVQPWVLNRGGDTRIGAVVSALKSVLGSKDAVFRTLKRADWILQSDLDKTVMPNVKYLKERCGISSSQITTYLPSCPRIFLLKPESLVKKVRRVEETGFDMKSKLLLQAIRVMDSMTPKNWEMKLEAFRRLGYGYSKDEILQLFKRTPQVFTVSEQKIEAAIRVYVTDGEVDMPYLVKRPVLLTFSVDQRVKPRLRIVKMLGEKDLLKKRPDLGTIMKMSRHKFFEKYVLPYSDTLGHDFVAACQPKPNKGLV